MIQQLQTKKLDNNLEINLLKFIMEIQETEKVSNPQMLIRKILELVKPKYSQCLEIICNLIRQSNDTIEKGEEYTKITDLIQNFAENWQESDYSEHLNNILTHILDSERSLSVLVLYKQILNQTIDVSRINNQDRDFLIQLGLITEENTNLIISNILYRKIFNADFINEQIDKYLEILVTEEWELFAKVRLQNYQLNVVNIKEVVTIIKEYLSTIATKTDNLEFVIHLIIKWSILENLLLKSLLKFASEIKDKISVNNEDEVTRFFAFLYNELKKNIEKLPTQELAHHFNYIERYLTNNNKCDSFWLLVTYRDILRGEKSLLNMEKEEEELLNLGLVLHHLNNMDSLLIVANKVYESYFSQEWVEEKLRQINKPQSQNILSWLDSNEFKTEHITILKSKFPTNVKAIIEEIIFWSHEHRTITEKIIKFINVSIISVESEDTEWFKDNIIYSPHLGEYLNQEDFKILINHLVAELNKVTNVNQINQSMVQLTTKFKQNPLIIAKAILAQSKGKPNLTKKMVDLILRDDGIIRTEADVDQIPEVIKSLENPNREVLDMPRPNNNNINDNQMTQQELFEKIADKAKEFLKAIVLVDLAEGEIINYKYNEDELGKAENEKIYEKLIGSGSGGIAVEDFETLIPSSKAWNKFAEETEAGELEYSIQIFTKRSVIAAFLNLDGQIYGVFYLGKSGVPRAKLVNVCEQTIIQIKDVFQRDKNFQFLS